MQDAPTHPEALAPAVDSLNRRPLGGGPPELGSGCIDLVEAVNGWWLGLSIDWSELLPCTSWLPWYG